MKYALVTGGSRGLGRAVCLKLSQMGIPVIINYQSNKEAAEQVRDMIIANGGDASLMQFNVADQSQVNAALQAWEGEHPDDYIAYLVNNAGIRKDNVMFMMPDSDWHSVIDVTVNGFFYVTKCLLPKMMMRKHGGRIVNMGSIWGLAGKPGRVSYAATKHGIHGVTQTLAVELAPYNILVNTVCPGFTLTELTYKNNTPEQIEEISGYIPMGRMASPAEQASVICYLASEENTYITGQQLASDGGYTAK